MSSHESAFYVTGGTLRHDAPSYVERQADRDLRVGLLKGEFCYVLTSRQMGKSSLMVRTATKLRDQGIQVVVLDLTAIGQNLTPEQWYDGLLVRMGRQLRLEEELEDFWKSHPELGPCQRLFTALREVVLKKLSVVSGPLSVVGGLQASAENEHSTKDNGQRTTDKLVLFVDELDVVRSLPFSTDEFFAAIRECYNRRTEDPEFNRLTFCLLGVATPSDLIRDARITPFNIGRRIELNDFTEEEAAPLANGLQGGAGEREKGREGANTKRETRNTKLLLRRILHWTNGHPYLTQRLCQRLAEVSGAPAPDVTAASSAMSGGEASAPQFFSGAAVVDDQAAAMRRQVDTLCEELFLSNRARERDDNLLFVRERLLRSGADLAGLLTLYGQVRRGKPVVDDETNGLVGVVRLSGITRAAKGQLQVRNRIYERVFDRKWIEANMPDAEVRRQKAAFRRGLVRATSIAAVIIAAITLLAVYALNQSGRARQEAQRADLNARSELRQRELAERNVYAADMILAFQALEANTLGRARELVQKHIPKPDQKDLRGWEWRYLWKQCQGDELFTLGTHSNGVTVAAFFPDGRTVASAGKDRTVKLWDLESRRLIEVLPHSGRVDALVISSDGKLLVSASEDGTIRLWDATTRKVTSEISGAPFVNALVLSSDDRVLAWADPHHAVVWDVAARRELASYSGNFGLPTWKTGIALSPDSRYFAFGRNDGKIEVWDWKNNSRKAALTGHKGEVLALAFVDEGKLLLSGANDSTASVWNVDTAREVAKLTSFSSWVSSFAISPDGKTLAAASGDQTVKVWNAKTWEEIATLRGHEFEVWWVAYSPDGRKLVTASLDGTIKVWDPTARRERSVAKPMPPDVTHFDMLANGRTGLFDISADGKTVLLLSTNSTFSLIDTTTLHEAERRFIPVATNIASVAISSDTTIMAVAGKDGSCELFDPSTAHEQSRFSAKGAPVLRQQFSRDGKTLAVQSNRKIELWDTTTKHFVRELETRSIWSSSLRFSPDGSRLAVGYRDSTVEIWDLSTARPMTLFAGHKEEIRDLAFSHDGKILVTTSPDLNLKLWDVATGKYLAKSGGRFGGYVHLGFSPDDRRLVTGGGGSVTLWDIVSPQPQEVGKFKIPEDDALFASFLPDGDTLVVLTFDGMIRQWRAPSQAEIERKETATAKQK